MLLRSAAANQVHPSSSHVRPQVQYAHTVGLFLTPKSVEGSMPGARYTKELSHHLHTVHQHAKRGPGCVQSSLDNGQLAHSLRHTALFSWGMVISVQPRPQEQTPSQAQVTVGWPLYGIMSCIGRTIDSCGPQRQIYHITTDHNSPERAVNTETQPSERLGHTCGINTDQDRVHSRFSVFMCVAAGHLHAI